MIRISVRTRTVVAIAAVPALLVLSQGPASADHVHFRYLGNGECVLLAPDGGEKDVQLPNSTYPPNRSHPLHVNVHLGTAGGVGQIPAGQEHSVYVAYPASGVLTPAAIELCGGVFVNR
jgi:hypothetical protein